jgi:lipoprotein signal peptidase
LAAGTANVVVMRVFGRSHDLATFKSIFATADTGILLGGVLGALTSIVHNRKLELIAGTVVGGVISLALGVFFYLVEWAFIAPSDTSLWANAFIFLLGGAVAGAVLSNVIEMLS